MAVKCERKNLIFNVIKKMCQKKLKIVELHFQFIFSLTATMKYFGFYLILIFVVFQLVNSNFNYERPKDGKGLILNI